jgi:hypothetical protein
MNYNSITRSLKQDKRLYQDILYSINKYIGNTFYLPQPYKTYVNAALKFDFYNDNSVRILNLISDWLLKIPLKRDDIISIFNDDEVDNDYYGKFIYDGNKIVPVYDYYEIITLLYSS